MQLSPARTACPPFVHDGAAPLPAAFRGSVMLLGSFDGFHRGHRAVLAAGRALAAELGAPLSILQCEPHPRVFFGGPAAFRLVAGAARQLLLTRAGFDLVFAPRFDAGFAATPAEDFVAEVLVGALGVAGVVCGPDFRFGRGRGGDVALLARMSAALGYALAVPAEVRHQGARVSSTAIRAAIGAGELATAAQLLGRPWTTGLVPGAVWSFAPEQLLPPAGRYAVAALDAAGQGLGRAVLQLGQGGSPQLQVPSATRILRWSRRPATAP